MTQKEVERFHLLQSVKEKRLTLKEAARQLGLSLRQIMRIWKRFKMEGKKGIISRKKGRPACNAIALSLRKKNSPKPPRQIYRLWANIRRREARRM